MDGQGSYGADGLAFRKMHGLGNDFVVLDARGRADPTDAALARALGDRHRGVGFDQLAVIRDGSAGATVDVDFWNADGSRAGACGNATRCVAALLMAEGHTAPSIRTARGILASEPAADGAITVDMGPPELDWTAIPLARAAETAALPLPGAPVAVSMGNPHCVFFVPDAETVDLLTEGPRWEHDPLFPERANISMASVRDPASLRLRVWERGAGQTLACGSAACAAVVAAVRCGLTGRQVAVHLDGGRLDIHWRADDGHVLMTGPVSDVFEGRIGAGFLAGIRS